MEPEILNTPKGNLLLIERIDNANVIYEIWDQTTLKFKMQRESIPPYNWMLQDVSGKFITRDQYRHDIFSRIRGGNYD